MIASNSPSRELSGSETVSFLGWRNRLVAYYKDISIGLLLLAAPFLLFPVGYGLLALLLLPMVWFIRWLAAGRIIPRTPLDWPLLLMLSMVLISMQLTFDLSFSIGKITGVLLGITLYYAVVELAETRSSFQTLLFFFILCGVGLAVISAMGTRWKDKFPIIEPLINQVPQTMLQGVRQAEQGFNPNQVGGVLLFFIPLQVVLLGYWLKRTGRKLKEGELFSTLQEFTIKNLALMISLGISLIVTAGVLLLTQSRGAIGGLAIGFVTIAAIWNWWGRVVAAGLFVALIGAFRLGLVKDLLTKGLETEAFGTMYLDARLEIWARALQGLTDYPLGMGMNAFRRLMPVLYPSPLFPPHVDMAHAHNHLLQAGLDLGIPGLVAYLALWLTAGFLLMRIILRPGSQFYQAIALGLAGSFTAYFVYGLTDAVALGAKPGFVFWWALGLAVAAYILSFQEMQKR